MYVCIQAFTLNTNITCHIRCGITHWYFVIFIHFKEIGILGTQQSEKNSSDQSDYFQRLPVYQNQRDRKVMIRVTGNNENWMRPHLPLTFQCWVFFQSSKVFLLFVLFYCFFQLFLSKLQRAHFMKLGRMVE